MYQSRRRRHMKLHTQIHREASFHIVIIMLFLTILLRVNVFENILIKEII